MSKHDTRNQDKYRKETGSKLKGLTVMVKQNADGTSDITGALRVLKKRLIQENVSKELREHEFHVTKGAKRRFSKAEATRRYKRLLRDQNTT